MKRGSSAIYSGQVVHRRVKPIRHSLRYDVFALLLDSTELDQLSKRLRVFSYNRFNLISFHDRDHGDAGDLNAHLWRLAKEAGCDGFIDRFAILCYPRVLGFVFNPLTVYFGLDTVGIAHLIVYEVNNTFGQRMSYVVPAEPGVDGAVHQQCDKQFYVSPFNKVDGRYSFNVTSLDDALTVGVSLTNEEVPVMLAFFRAKRIQISDRALLQELARTGWLAAKVVLGIRFEAVRLWLKGMRLVDRPEVPRHQIVHVTTGERTVHLPANTF